MLAAVALRRYLLAAAALWALGAALTVVRVGCTLALLPMAAAMQLLGAALRTCMRKRSHATPLPHARRVDPWWLPCLFVSPVAALGAAVCHCTQARARARPAACPC